MLEITQQRSLIWWVKRCRLFINPLNSNKLSNMNCIEKLIRNNRYPYAHHHPALSLCVCVCIFHHKSCAWMALRRHLIFSEYQISLMRFKNYLTQLHLTTYEKDYDFSVHKVYKALEIFSLDKLVDFNITHTIYTFYTFANCTIRMISAWRLCNNYHSQFGEFIRKGRFFSDEMFIFNYDNTWKM